MKIGEIDVVGTYIETDKRFSEYYYVHTYKDEQNRYFSLTDDGKLCTYFFGNNPSPDKEKNTYTESECIDISNKFISAITDISEYTVSAVFEESTKMYTVSYIKQVDGFICSDRADIRIEETGYIYSFSSMMLGRIASDTTTNFDRDVIQAQIISKLDHEYRDAKQIYDKVSYENFQYTLTVDGHGKPALICAVDVNCINFGDEFDEVIPGRIRFIVQ